MSALSDMIKTRAGYTDSKSCLNCRTVGNANPLRCHAFENLITLNVVEDKVCSKHVFGDLSNYPDDVDNDNPTLQPHVETAVNYCDSEKCLKCHYYSDSDSNCLRFKELEPFEVLPNKVCSFFSRSSG